MPGEKQTSPSRPKFDHGHAPVFVLIPYDELEQRPCHDAFEVEFSKLETQPKVVKELRVGRLPSDAVVYIAHPYSVREKVAEGEYKLVNKVHISEPLEIKRFGLTNGDDDGLGIVNVPAITDAVQALCRNTKNGKVFRAQLSADKDWAVKTVKLFNN